MAKLRNHLTGQQKKYELKQYFSSQKGLLTGVYKAVF
jgi:hypothetical protein